MFDKARLVKFAVLAFAVVVAWFAFRHSHDALLVIDGHAYMEMAKAMATHRDLEARNGLDRIDSVELFLSPTVKIGPHMYGKYPPLYAVIAALPFALGKIPGLYALNAAFLAVMIVAYYSLATRLLHARLALASTLVLPFATPLYSYVAMELPHLLAAGLLLAAIACFAFLLEARDGGAALGWALAAGLLSGLSVGVRLQNIFPAVVLVGSAALHAPRRVHAVVGQVVTLGACLLAMTWMNQWRWGVPSPFTYGPPGVLGSPPATVTAGHFASGGFVLVLLTIALTGWVVHRHTPARRWQTLAAITALVIALVVIPPLRHTATWMGESAFSFLVNAAAFFAGWDVPCTTFNWINKPLLSGAPWLAVGLVGMVIASTRAKSPLARTLGWISVAVILFMSRLHPDPLRPDVSGDPSVIGFLSLSPRYLVELMPILFLLGWWLIRDVRLDGFALALGLAPAVVLMGFFSQGGDDTEPMRAWILMTGSIALAAFVLVGVVHAKSSARSGRVLAIATGLCLGYGAAVTLGVDTLALDEMGETNETWSRVVLAKTPEKLVIVGSGRAADAVFGIRSTRDAIYLDYTLDAGAALLETLRAVSADGRPIYYFGLGLEGAQPILDREYEVVMVSSGPLLWRLDPRRR